MATDCLSVVMATGEEVPRIVEAARKLKATSFLIDGEAVVCGPDGVSNFDRLHSQAYNGRVFLFGFDLLQFDGGDWREQPLESVRRSSSGSSLRATASSIPSILRATARSSSSTCANSGSRGSCPSAAIFPTARGARGIG
jgi:hypothetical protein